MCSSDLPAGTLDAAAGVLDDATQPEMVPCAVLLPVPAADAGADEVTLPDGRYGLEAARPEVA